MKIKKCFLIFVGLSIIQASQIIAQQSYGDIPAASKSTFFKETFDNNSNNWILDNLWIKGDIAYGGYNLVCRNYQKSTGLSYKNISIDQGKDYEIETALNALKGNGGLAFGITNKFDHYRIEISANNTLTIQKNTPSKGKIEVLFSGPVSANTQPGSFNKITVRKLKDYFYVFVNETFIGSFNNIKPEGDQLGFNVGLNSEISVDFLTVSYLSGQTSPITAMRNITKEEPAKTQSENNAAKVSLPTNTANIPSQNDSKIPKGSPLIIWTSPSGVNTTLDTYTARVRATVISGSDLKSVLFYVNSSSKGEGEIKSSTNEAGTYVVEKSISLTPGDNNIYIVATNFEGASKSELRYFSNPPANPPVIAWGNPVYENVAVNSDQFTIEACIESPTELKSAKILVNGNPQGESTVFQVSGIEKCNYKWQQTVILKEGDNIIYIIATNIAGSNTSEKRTIKYQMAIAEKRLALVIGNSDYIDKSSLRNPINDANLMEATLKQLGFVVIKRTNAGINSMREAVREFSGKLSEYNVALFYYAGHGIQMEGRNYLLPTDAVLKDPSDCKYEAIPVDFVTEEFAKYPENTNIVILDACRNNPYKSFTRGGAPGFKAISPTSGTIIAFATAEGSTAIDGTNANGLFTEELVKQMLIPQPIESVFKKTRVEVKKRSKDQQTPVDWNSLDGDFYFKK